MYKTEKEAVDVVRRFFDAYGWEYKEQYPTKSGKAIDFYVKAPHDGGFIFFGVEVKKDLSGKTNATVLADYLEQARAYSVDLDAPVFLAPAQGLGVAELSSGGENLRAISALSIFGGRVNVGILSREERYYKGISSVNWYMVMRGGVFWKHDAFNPKRLTMVSSTGSKKERRNIKIWRPINV